jgi:hypothetical protein
MSTSFRNVAFVIWIPHSTILTGHSHGPQYGCASQLTFS